MTPRATKRSVSSFTYDADGNMLTASSSAGTITMTYDGDQLATRTDANGLTLTYNYDADGNVTSLVDSQGATTTFAYNGDGQVKSEDLPGRQYAVGVDFTYDGDGNLTGATRYSDLAGTDKVVRRTTVTMTMS